MWVAAVAACMTASVAVTQAPESPGDWPMYSLDLGGSRFSPLQTHAAQRRPPRRSLGRAGRARGRRRQRCTGRARQSAGDADRGRRRAYCRCAATKSSRSRHTRARRSGGTRCVRRSARPRAASRTGPATARSAPRILLMAGPTLVALDAARAAPAPGSARTASCRLPCRGTACRLIYATSRSWARRRTRSPSPARRHARVRRAHGQAALDVPHRAAAGRGRPRDVARQRLAEPFGRQRLGVVHDARRGARHSLHAGVERGR